MCVIYIIGSWLPNSDTTIYLIIALHSIRSQVKLFAINSWASDRVADNITVGSFFDNNIQRRHLNIMVWKKKKREKKRAKQNSLFLLADQDVRAARLSRAVPRA